MAIVHHEIETFKSHLLQKLKDKPAPYGAPPDSLERRVLERCLDDLSRTPPALAGCEREFEGAVKKILLYEPNGYNKSSRQRFTDFLAHLRNHPEFYVMFDRVVLVAVDAGLVELPAAMVAYRTAFELCSNERLRVHRQFRVNLSALYGEYWMFRNPDVPFLFRRRKGALTRIKHSIQYPDV